MARIADLRNLGPVMERRLAEIAVHDSDDLARLGAVEAWRRLSFAEPRMLTRIGLYALAGALIERDWRDLPAGLKADLDREAEAIRLARKPLSRRAKRR